MNKNLLFSILVLPTRTFKMYDIRIIIYVQSDWRKFHIIYGVRDRILIYYALDPIQITLCFRMTLVLDIIL